LAVASFALAAVLAAAPRGSAFVAPLSGQLFVSPETTVTAEQSSLVIGFDVTSDVAGLMGYNIGVTFDHNLIDLQSAYEGALPASSSDTTFFYYWHDPVTTGDDSVLVNGAVLGRTVDGPGTLFTLSFETAEVAQPETTRVLITFSELRNGVNQSIAHTVRGGVVVIEPSIAVKPSTWGKIKSFYAE
jgi:hypothetical protein